MKCSTKCKSFNVHIDAVFLYRICSLLASYWSAVRNERLFYSLNNKDNLLAEFEVTFLIELVCVVY